MPKRILVVEDNDDCRTLLVKALSRAGYEVVPAASSAEAISICGQSNFDLLLGDIALPDRDGYSLMQELAESCKIKGIAYTGLGHEIDLRRAKEAGFSAVLIKPVGVGLLPDKVAEILNS